MKKVLQEKFKYAIWNFYREHGRHGLAWRRTTDPYHIFVSEIMLQQTQVSRVSIKYPQFLEKFSSFMALSQAPTAEVIIAWQGMGYNRRAVYLQNSARIICDKFNGILPEDPDVLETLPGIGPNTAGSISCFAYNKPTIFIETNIRRVFIHHFFKDQQNVSDKQILALVDTTLDTKDPRQWYYALMDYGSHLRSMLAKNPNTQSRHYSRQSKFEGSDREVRAFIVKLLAQNGIQSQKDIHSAIHELRPQWPEEKILQTVQKLKKDGLVVIHDTHMQLG